MTTETQVDTVLQELEPLEQWAQRCHEASLHLVRSRILGPSRVARGSCKGVDSQHSWVVLGLDCYDDKAKIIDPTLWSYDDNVEGIWFGSYSDGRHRPHGKGSIWRWGRPEYPTGPIVALTPRKALSGVAQDFLALLGPLDQEGWGQLAHAPVEGWPAGEIFDAIYHTKQLSGLIPIDIVGMITDINPGNLYGGERWH